MPELDPVDGDPYQSVTLTPVNHDPYSLDGFIDSYSAEKGVDPSFVRRVMHIESGGNPANTTGSYHGLFQLSWPEYVKYGGTGNIYDPVNNARAAINKIAVENEQFRQKYGRDPTPTDTYLVHNQGAGGYAAHMANPDAPAWQNMYSTAEGREKGPAWAKQAIWGNIPDTMKAQFPGGVDSVTSRQFTDLWRGRVEGPNAGPGYAMASNKPSLSNIVASAQQPTQADKEATGPDFGAGLTSLGKALMKPIKFDQAPTIASDNPYVVVPPPQA